MGDDRGWRIENRHPLTHDLSILKDILNLKFLPQSANDNRRSPVYTRSRRR
jgi:hypothetical protein